MPLSSSQNIFKPQTLTNCPLPIDDTNEYKLYGCKILKQILRHALYHYPGQDFSYNNQ